MAGIELEKLLKTASLDGKYYAVLDSACELSIIDPDSDAVIGTIDLSEYSDRDFSVMRFNSSDTLCITEIGGASVIFINCETLKT